MWETKTLPAGTIPKYQGVAFMPIFMIDYLGSD
jgi:hypothetical protein